MTFHEKFMTYSLEERKELAKAVGASLRTLDCAREHRSKLSLGLAIRLAKATNNRLPLSLIRPDLHKLYPNL